MTTEPTKTETNDEYRKEALRLAGILADAATRLVGGHGLFGWEHPADIITASSRAEALQRAVSDYNFFIVKWELSK